MAYKTRTYRLRAFTFVELLVVLLISSLIVFSAISIILISNKMTSVFFTNNASTQNLFALSMHLQDDIYFSRKIKPFYNEGITIISSKNEVNYTFSREYTIRTCEELTDTFFVQTNDWLVGTEVKQNKEKDYLYLQVLLSKDTIPLLFFRSYTNRELVIDDY